jgi:hypothetical protein
VSLTWRKSGKGKEEVYQSIHRLRGPENEDDEDTLEARMARETSLSEVDPDWERLYKVKDRTNDLFDLCFLYWPTWEGSWNGGEGYKLHFPPGLQMQSMVYIF